LRASTLAANTSGLFVRALRVVRSRRTWRNPAVRNSLRRTPPPWRRRFRRTSLPPFDSPAAAVRQGLAQPRRLRHHGGARAPGDAAPRTPEWSRPRRSSAWMSISTSDGRSCMRKLAAYPQAEGRHGEVWIDVRNVPNGWTRDTRASFPRRAGWAGQRCAGSRRCAAHRCHGSPGGRQRHRVSAADSRPARHARSRMVQG